MRDCGWIARRLAGAVALLAVAIAAPLCNAAGPASAPATNAQIADLIQQLGSPDPTERDQAQTSLIQIGEPARAQLKAATANDFPAIAMGAAAVLNWPWYTADDPPEIQQMLDGYGDKDVDQRHDIAMELGDHSQAGFNAMIRIVAREPSDTVRWVMVDWLVVGALDPRHKLAARSVPVIPDSPPLLILAGRAWSDLDPVKSAGFYQQAYELWKSEPDFFSRDDVFPLLGDLRNADMRMHRYESAAEILRAEIGMNWQPGFRRPDQLCRLFMLHAQFGPLKGYADDIAMAGAWLNAPLGLYCQSLMAQRLMMPQKAEDLRQKAVRAAGNSAQTAYETGTDLADCGLSDLALPLLNTFLSMPTNIPGIVDSTDEARLRLALIYASKGDYQHAADMRNAIQKSLVQRGLRQLDIVDLDWGYVDYGIGQSTLDLDWRESRLKAAEEQHDAAGISSELDALLGLNSEFMDMDIVPLLVERGRQAEASAVFDRAYGKARALVDADPDTPKYLNDLARLCIRCDQRPAEADEMARKAVAAAPTEPEYIDTLATCELNIGRPREAVRLETIAVSLDRDNFAYIRQLDRFRAAAAAQAAR